jgi:Histone methylation protein DOT1
MKLKTIAKLNSMLWEIRLGIRTRGLVEIKERDYKESVGTPYHTMWKILNSLSLVDSDVFVDIGCGKGRAVCCAARLGVRKVIGVEYSPELCRIAEANASNRPGLTCSPPRWRNSCPTRSSSSSSAAGRGRSPRSSPFGGWSTAPMMHTSIALG